MGKQNSSKNGSKSLNSKDPDSKEPTDDRTPNEWPSWYTSRSDRKRRILRNEAERKSSAA